MKAHTLYSLLITLFCWWAPLNTHAQSTGASQIFPTKDKTKVLLNAQFIERDNDKGISILRGDVQIILEQNFISCDEAIILWANNEIIAVGNVLLKTPKSDVQAEKIVYNFKDQTGKIFNGIIVSGKVLIQSDYIQKTGPDTYVSSSSYLTSCETCPASWSFTADNVDATIEGYAYIKNSWLHVLEVPILFMPYLVLPLKNQRQSGLLTPIMEVNPYAGFGVELPYFWAISRSQDMTLSAKNYKESGLQGLLNYRYRLTEKSGGELGTALLWDRRQNNARRWHTSYVHYLELPHKYIQRTNINLASDIDYVEHFQQQFPHFGLPALDNRTSITKNFDDFHLSIDTSYYVSLLQDSLSDGRDASVHRLPEIRFSLTDQKIFDKPPVFFRFNSQYINLARQGLGFDSPFTTVSNNIGYRPITGTGVFDPAQDKIRTGQRLDLQPMIYSPLRAFNQKLDITPYVMYRHTQYVLGALNESQEFDFFPHRNYTQVGVNTSTEMSAIYQGAENRYRHSIVPEVSFQSITNSYQNNNTFFGSQTQVPYFLQTQPLQDLDLDPSGRGLQFDYEDRIIGKRLMNFSLTNKVVTKSDSPLGQTYTQPLLFAVSQAYDLIEAQNENGRPWQDIRGILNMRMGKVDSLTEASHFPYHKVTNVSSRLRLALLDTNYFEIIYTNYLNVPARPEDVNINNRQEATLLNLGITSTYITVNGNVEYSIKDSEWKRWTVSTVLIPPGDCWTITTNLFKNLDSDEFGGNGMITFKFGK